MAGNVIELTDETFKAEVINSELPVLVDMWAPWCGPCLLVSPAIEKLAADNAGKIKVCKLNVDEAPAIAAAAGIMAIPTALFYRDGEEVTALRVIGARSKADYQALIDQLVE